MDTFSLKKIINIVSTSWQTNWQDNFSATSNICPENQDRVNPVHLCWKYKSVFSERCSFEKILLWLQRYWRFNGQLALFICYAFTLLQKFYHVPAMSVSVIKAYDGFIYFIIQARDGPHFWTKMFEVNFKIKRVLMWKPSPKLKEFQTNLSMFYYYSMRPDLCKFVGL